MNNIFQTVKLGGIKRSKINLSHEKKMSFNMGKLVPILVEECLPGDSFDISSETMIRLAPMLAPVMHRFNAYVHFFFVPNRILWDGWENFITGQSETVAPNYSYQNPILLGGILDFLGVPTHVGTGTTNINTLPLRAYKSIWNEYYRDQNLQGQHSIENDDEDYEALYTRAWQKDYFTSALPWAQKGDPVTMPVTMQPDYKRPEYTLSDESTGNFQHEDGNANNIKGSAGSIGGTLSIEEIDNLNEMESEIDINDFRNAHRIQRWLEKNARAGTRYVEHILAHFGVISDDARLDRPEYLGGGKSPVVISEVVNTTGFTDDEANALPQGNMAGHGINIGQTNKASKYCKEHGFIMGIMSVMPTANYYQGLPRKLSRQTNMDYFYPEFAQLGEQEVLNKEIYNEDHAAKDDVFGYQARYAEYKHSQDTVHGDFRDTLKFWTEVREFASRPALNAEFIKCNPSGRIFAVQEQDHLWVNVYNRIIAKRPMPLYNVPTL